MVAACSAHCFTLPTGLPVGPHRCLMQTQMYLAGKPSSGRFLGGGNTPRTLFCSSPELRSIPHQNGLALVQAESTPEQKLNYNAANGALSASGFSQQ